MTDQSFHIVVAEHYEDWALDRLRAVGRVTTLPDHHDPTLRQAVGDADALLVRTYARVTAALINAAPRLRVIGRGGSGVENIDLEAAQARGIVVVSTPAASTDAVADLTIGLMIDLVRGLRKSEVDLRAGRFLEARRDASGRELHELTVGIIGLGRIGKAVARRCRNGFGMTVIYNDIADAGWLDFVAQPESKEVVYGSADIVSIHVPLTPETRGLICGDALRNFRRGAFLINTARGAVVDCLSLARSLESGQLAGAGLDVTDPEPLPPDHPLLSAPNTRLTPHLGAKTLASYQRMNEVVDDVIRVLRGQAPIFPISA